MTPREALDRIAAICVSVERAQDSGEPMVFTRRVRAVLAEVSPEPGGATSDDHQRGYAQGYTEGRAAGWDERGALGGVLDRDQARAVLRRAVVAYVTGGLEALQEVTGPDPVESPVFWEAVTRIGANRRALNTGRRPRSGIDKWDRGTFNAEEQHDDDRYERRGGNL